MLYDVKRKRFVNKFCLDDVFYVDDVDDDVDDNVREVFGFNSMMDVAA